MSAVVTLLNAKERIREPQHWGKTDYATDSRGYLRDPKEPDACVFCAVGAVMSVLRCPEDVLEAQDCLATAAGDHNIPHFNDATGRTHVEIMALFDRAIELAVLDEERQ